MQKEWSRFLRKKEDAEELRAEMDPIKEAIGNTIAYNEGMEELSNLMILLRKLMLL